MLDEWWIEAIRNFLRVLGTIMMQIAWLWSDIAIYLNFFSKFIVVLSHSSFGQNCEQSSIFSIIISLIVLEIIWLLRMAQFYIIVHCAAFLSTAGQREFIWYFEIVEVSLLPKMMKYVLLSVIYTFCLFDACTGVVHSTKKVEECGMIANWLLKMNLTH